MAAKQRKKTTQTYECIDLFTGLSRDSGHNSVGMPRQEETQVRIAILRGQYSSTFIINRLREGVSKAGNPWKKWEVWGQLVISTKALNKAGDKKLNLYGKFRMRNTPGPTQWFPFSNITSNPSMLSSIVSGSYIEAVNKEIEHLYTENIGVPPISREDYFEATPFSHPALSYSERAVMNREKKDPYEYALHLAYPLARDMKLRDGIPSGMTSAFREDTMMEAVRKMYGKTRYRKDLVRAVSKAPLPLNVVAVELRGTVPTDWVIDFLNAHQGVFSRGLEKHLRPAFRALFKSLTPAQQKRLLASLTTTNKKEIASYWAVVDTLRMFKSLKDDYNATFVPGQIPGKRWSELHEIFRADLSTREVVDKPIEKVPLAQEIEKVQFPEGYRIIQPETTHDLIEWGRKMEHCIGSYIKEAVQGESVFLGIMKDDMMIGNAQIRVRDKNLVQIFGKRNRILDREVLDGFSTSLIDNKVLTVSSFKHSYGFQPERNPFMI